MIKTITVNPRAHEESKDHKPALIKWKGQPMIRVHSLRATVKEIISMTEVLDVIKIGIIGDQSTGKTTLEDTLAHLIHKMSPMPWAIRAFGEKEFLDMEKTLASLEPANYILKFRDLSFLQAVATTKQINIVKQVITKIRHLPGGQDVKIILVYDYHYTLGLDKYLRQANFRYFTSIGSSEKENMLDIVGNSNASMIEDFMRLYVEMTIKHKATFKVGSKYFVYDYKDPFVPCLFFNNANLRYVIFPKRQWIDPICSDCSTGDNPMLRSDVDLAAFKADRDKAFGTRTYEAAVKLKLFIQGKTTYSPKVVQALRDLDRSLEMKIITLEELATAYGLTITKTKLRKKPAQVLTESS